MQPLECRVGVPVVPGPCAQPREGFVIGGKEREPWWLLSCSLGAARVQASSHDEDEDVEEEKDSEVSVKDCIIGVFGSEASLAEVEQQSVGIAVAKPSQATFASLGSSVKAINYSCEYKRFDQISESSESEDCDADLFEQPA